MDSKNQMICRDWLVMADRLFIAGERLYGMFLNFENMYIGDFSFSCSQTY